MKDMILNIFNNSDCVKYFGKLFDSLNLGLLFNEIICDDGNNPVDFKILGVNTFIEKALRTGRQDIVGKTVKELYPQIDPKWIELCGRIALDGENLEIDKHFRFADRHFRVAIISPVKGQFIAIFTDITEVLKVDEIMKKHFMLIENAQDILLYINSHGKIIDANKAAVEKYGYTQSELLNMKLNQLSFSCKTAECCQHMGKSASKGVVFECIHMKKDGTAFPVEVSSRSIEINGEIIHFHIIRDISERKEAEKKIQYLANYDSLTGIPNRGYLMQHFSETIGASKRENMKLAVFLFDVDKFKLINDVHGHNAGDEVLKAVAERLQSAVRKTDMVGRLGGDEFLVIQSYIRGRNEAAILAGRILDKVAKPIKWNSVELDIRISIGVAVYPDDSSDPDELIQHADSAMYSIKQKGGNSYYMYTPNV